jgi:hypothetical protein
MRRRLFRTDPIHIQQFDVTVCVVQCVRVQCGGSVCSSAVRRSVACSAVQCVKCAVRSA